MSGWATPLVVVAIGIVNVAIAIWRKAMWFGGGSLLTALGGLVLLVSTALGMRASVLPYIAASLLIVSIFCYLASIVKREMRVTL